MNPQHIDADMRAYLENRELTCGGLIVRRGEEIILEQNWGYADPRTKTPADSRSLYRMMSMTKPVVAVAVMQQIEDGRLTLDTPVSRFLPSYRNPRVTADPRYESADWTDDDTIARLSAAFDPEAVKTVPAVRDITVRDLLTHSSGLAQGVVGMLCGQRDRTDRRTVADAAEGYGRYLLDFQPGTAYGYSPLAAFDVLLRVAELAADEEAASLLHRRIFAPLGMDDTTFFPTEEQKSRLVRLVRRENGILADKTWTGEDILSATLRDGYHYAMGGAGLCSTLRDYDRFVAMLLGEGTFGGARILSTETVRRMQTERMEHLPDPDAGMQWGLGMIVRTDPAKAASPCTAGTYGWSGAYGTHFIVSPADRLSAVWVTNRTDLNGSSSPISYHVEELVFEDGADALH